MPFESEAQRRFMHAVSPGLAKEFEKKTPKGKKLPKKKAAPKKLLIKKKPKKRVIKRK